MMMRAIYLCACGLLFAGIVHIAIILLIPVFGSKDAAKQIMRQSQLMKFSKLNDSSQFNIVDIDPYFENYVCRFDLSQDAVLISGVDRSQFWSASVFDAQGRVIYSLNDRTAIKNKLSVLIVSPIHMADIRQTQPAEVETSILVEMSPEQGFIVLRAAVTDNSQKKQNEAFLQSAKCQPYITR